MGKFLTVCHWYVIGSRPSWARALRTSLTWLGGGWTLGWKPSSSLWDRSPGTLSTCRPWQTSLCRFLDRPGRSLWGRRGIQRASSPLGNPQHHPIKLIWEVIFWKQNFLIFLISFWFNTLRTFETCLEMNSSKRRQIVRVTKSPILSRLVWWEDTELFCMSRSLIGQHVSLDKVPEHECCGLPDFLRVGHRVISVCNYTQKYDHYF